MSAHRFPTGADVAFVASGHDFADALASAPAAAALGAPVLLVQRTDVPSVTQRELERLSPSTVVIVGGPATVSESVAETLGASGYEVRRRAGANRYATAAAVAGAWEGSDVPLVVVASGEVFPDALSAAGAAASRSAPVLLVSRHVVPAPTREAILRMKPREIAVVGGVDVVSDGVVRDIATTSGARVVRWAGRDRYATAAAVTREVHPGGVVDAVLASGESFPDALAAAAGASRSTALLLSERSCVPVMIRSELDRLAPEDVTLVGGPAALSRVVAWRVSCRAPVVGTNYTHHAINDCTLLGTGIVANYHEAGVREKVVGQLRTMTQQNGIRSFRLIVWHSHDPGAEDWGIVPSAGGRLAEPFRSNLRLFLSDLANVAVEQLTIAFGAQGPNNPKKTDVTPELFEENWSVIQDVRALARQHGPPVVRLDLLNEAGEVHTRDYVSSMYRRYAAMFGTEDVTVSVIASGGVDVTRTRVQALVDAFRSSGQPMPRWFEVHLAYEYDGALEGLRTVDRVLDENGLAQPLVVGETAYDDPGVGAAVVDFIAEGRRPVLEVIQWPLTADRPCRNVSVAPPYGIDAYLAAVSAVA